ncbi:class I SAM-dependent methyltransferase [Lactococcus laudensis]|uniref:Class I SAM-dependent methyltransferase n=1 Tax=Pseudolactococcus laudensis TaxID=1494461 RepID=A0A7V8MZA2_9LACT|nr:class I SAM-dependent methyltransferase [Lactococcus laudensis]MBA0015726.1 class I SAM-dependent methyltransferase [Lactococcus laudensis]
MNMEKIETAFGLLLANVQQLETHLATHFYDALIEQNVSYLGKAVSDDLQHRNEQLRALNLTKLEWQKVYQFALVKGAKEMHLQANHQLTPDAIGYIIKFMIETLTTETSLSILELGSGTGNLAETLLTGMPDKDLTYTGFEVDDLMIDLSASIADVMQTSAQFLQIDAVRPQVIEPVDLLLSDLPVGYYPDDEIAKRSVVGSQLEHTYAHHLLMAQGFKYLKAEGYAIFVAPSDLLSSPQANLLKKWLQDYARVAAVITLPEDIVTENNSKAIFVLQKSAQGKAPFVFPLTSLTNPEIVQSFMTQFRQNMI